MIQRLTLAPNKLSIHLPIQLRVIHQQAALTMAVLLWCGKATAKTIFTIMVFMPSATALMAKQSVLNWKLTNLIHCLRKTHSIRPTLPLFLTVRLWWYGTVMVIITRTPTVFTVVFLMPMAHQRPMIFK